MSDDTTYLELIEENDWEGETWHFFFTASAGEAEKVHDLISCDRSGSFTLVSHAKLTSGALDELIKTQNAFGRTGYINEYSNFGRISNTKISALLDLSAEEPDTIFDAFYKGGIKDYCVEAQS